MNDLIRNVRWLGHAGILINEKPVIYINPYKLAFPDIGDLILFTDNKEDHCSPEDAKWLRKGSTVIAGPTPCTERFQGDVRTLVAGEVVSIKGASITPFAVKETGENKPSGYNALGYGIKFSKGLTVFHPGDSVVTPEMTMGMADVLLVPVKVNGEFRLAEAAEIANQISPRLTVPINWDGKKESLPMMEEFKKLCKSAVEIVKSKP